MFDDGYTCHPHYSSKFFSCHFLATLEPLQSALFCRNNRPFQGIRRVTECLQNGTRTMTDELRRIVRHLKTSNYYVPTCRVFATGNHGCIGLVKESNTYS